MYVPVIEGRERGRWFLTTRRPLRTCRSSANTSPSRVKVQGVFWTPLLTNTTQQPPTHLVLQVNNEAH